VWLVCVGCVEVCAPCAKQASICTCPRGACTKKSALGAYTNVVIPNRPIFEFSGLFLPIQHLLKHSVSKIVTNNYPVGVANFAEVPRPSVVEPEATCPATVLTLPKNTMCKDSRIIKY